MEKKSNKTTWVVILIISLLVCVLCIGFLLWYFFIAPDNNLSRQPSTEAPSTEATISETVEETEAPTERFPYKTASLPENDFVDFKEIRSINKDIYAWIYIPNTNVDYPVAQSSQNVDDSFYLTHNVYKNYQFSGTIYTEKKNERDFSDPVTVIYGHNMLNGSMFATLHKFNDIDFFEKNNTIFVFTEDKIFTYLIYSAYQYDDRHLLNSFDMEDSTSFRQFLDTTLVKRPYYCNVRENIELSTEDRIITLSTCMNGGGNVRYLVQGVLVNEQDV